MDPPFQERLCLEITRRVRTNAPLRNSSPSDAGQPQNNTGHILVDGQHATANPTHLIALTLVPITELDQGHEQVLFSTRPSRTSDVQPTCVHLSIPIACRYRQENLERNLREAKFRGVAIVPYPGTVTHYRLEQGYAK
jgi:hypothetical protein